ncbi:MAG TPA: PIN domain-containing protein [Candidatus Polarisedimenticolia bacterium]|nr:PIN domain-containing protein [Candidatus Polarisedimenticolia bacterium]
MAFIRLVAALIGFVFGFFLGASLLQVTQVTPPTNQIYVVLLLATACAILGWLGAPYVTVVPARYVVNSLREASAGNLIGGAFGAAIGLMLALFLAFPLSFLPGDIGRYAPLVTAVVLGVMGATAGAVKRNELSAFAQGVRGSRRSTAADARVLLDTSIIIDGRIADVVRAGFVRGTLIIPKFVLAELQYFNDSPDGSRRERGRRGLEMLAKMQKEETVKVELSEEEPAGNGADGKLVTLAKSLGIAIMTNDYGLNRVAELQGITVLNMNDLAKAVRPVVLPGEEITVRVIQEGKEAAQAVGYLEDGTMVVVENGARHIGSEVAVTVMRVLQTVGGRMIFGHPKGEVTETRRPRAIDR